MKQEKIKLDANNGRILEPKDLVQAGDKYWDQDLYDWVDMSREDYGYPISILQLTNPELRVRRQMHFSDLEIEEQAEAWIEGIERDPDFWKVYPEN